MTRDVPDQDMTDDEPAEKSGLYVHYLILSEELGSDAAILAMRAFGGQTVKIPGELRDDCAVVQRLAAELKPGDDASLPGFISEWLVSAYPFVELTFASLRDAAQLASDRRQAIIDSPHLSANNLAKRLCISKRRVEQIRQELSCGPGRPGEVAKKRRAAVLETPEMTVDEIMETFGVSRQLALAEKTAAVRHCLSSDIGESDSELSERLGVSVAQIAKERRVVALREAVE